MGVTALHILLLVHAFTLTTQEWVTLSVSPKITAECGKPVTLQCKVSSSENGLKIKHIEWSNSKMSCSVDSEGNITYQKSLLNDFHCEYKDGQLSLIFEKVEPQATEEPYGCKLRSNQGVQYKTTAVELQECCAKVEGDLTSDGPICTFSNVYPDGDVHWFHGSHYLSDRSTERKRVSKGGWLTVHSHLKRKSSDVPYNCSLWSNKSGRYIASTLVGGNARISPISSSHRKSQGPMWIVPCVSVILAVTLK